MNENNAVSNIDLKYKIHTLRGVSIMLDEDLAMLYDVETKVLNQTVKRNIDRFPNDFMFQLSELDYNILRSQNVTLKNTQNLKSQNATLDDRRGLHRKYLPYVFTEQGVASLSGILKSKKAIEINIQIMRAFVSMRKFISKNADIFRRLDFVEQKQLKYDTNFEKVFNAIENKEIQPK
ncbi:MAG: ORF6N domain-containing protein, partial [Candidatus Aenigmarchaeota archaeon]|nr:ORF6N domain-containing protein [Candidatus Aenigmarchaeota archaeon]